MIYKIKVPARINILGNPSDANEGDFATISAAVDIYAHAFVEAGQDITLEAWKAADGGFKTIHQESFSKNHIPLPYNGELDLLKGGINRLYQYSSEFRAKLQRHGFKIATWTDVPRQSGLGGSSLFVILVLGGLRTLYDLNPDLHNDYLLAELTQRVEAKELGITAGYADRYVPLFGGIAYLDYRGKIHQAALHEEPYTTYERLDQWVDDLSLVAVSSGLERDSGDVHGQMRPRYLEEYNNWLQNGGERPPMVKFMTEAWETAWRGKIALLQRDWKSFGLLMNRNHRAVDEMMTYCGFVDGAGWANNLLIETALSNGAFGAKLTGAGSGGSVFAITRPEQISGLKSAWKNACISAGLKKAKIYQPKIDFEGMVVELVDGPVIS
jgi:galactokinase/mevalonate kinase-like predicted kinase